MAETTLLAISGIDIPPYAARGLTQSLEPIGAAASMRRTVNGDLRNLGQTQFRKYASEISCSDIQHPALDGVWQGQQVVVDCVCELSYLTAGGSPERTAVPGSSRVEGDYTFYRPRLTMLVTGFQTRFDEYGAVADWSLSLEEV
ncbi:MAG: hypothetical protein K2Y29_00400 [Beijerinckiaceae bacterium]|nr:hypothetical protein [Beijerinckiaceae bacterium]